MKSHVTTSKLRHYRQSRVEKSKHLEAGMAALPSLLSSMLRWTEQVFSVRLLIYKRAPWPYTRKATCSTVSEESPRTDQTWDTITLLPWKSLRVEDDATAGQDAGGTAAACSAGYREVSPSRWHAGSKTEWSGSTNFPSFASLYEVLIFLRQGF